MATTSLVKCDCDRCDCEISLEKAVEKNGKHYCCEACANGHAKNDGCKMSDCGCGSN